MDDTVKTPAPELPLALLRFRFIAETPMRLPEWPGSMLRGAFGHALRRAACMVRQRDCAACPLYHTCPYPAVFAPPPRQHAIQHFSQPPVPYLIEPEKWGARELQPGDVLQFSMVLMGRALTELALIVHAWTEAAAHGLGPNNGMAALSQVEYLPPQGAPVPIHRQGDARLKPFTPVMPLVPAAANPTTLTLSFTSPLRLQENGHALSLARLMPRTLLMAAVRRVALISEFYGSGTPTWNFSNLTDLSSTIRDEKRLHWQDWTRRSSRQQRTMQLGGVVGTWQLFGNLAPFFPALYLGQWLHVGKEAVFGMGRYALTWEKQSVATHVTTSNNYARMQTLHNE
jgi:hypothetical protein